MLADLEPVWAAALAAAAMSIDACRGTDAFLDERVHAARGQDGQSDVARRLRALIAGSQIIPSHLHGDPRVQDPYSLRCVPQVLGAARDADRVRARHRRARAGRGHRQSAGLRRRSGAHAAGGLGRQLPRHAAGAGARHAGRSRSTHIAGISERRTYYILAASDAENPLNPQLASVPGLCSGLMIAQYVAAACCNELIGLATPASVANIPTSAGIEDYNSMGATSARKARRALERVTDVVAIELLCAAEALEYQRPLRSGAGVEAAHAAVRTVVSRRTGDRPPAPDIRALADLIRAADSSPFARSG